MCFHKSSGLKNESAYGSDRARARKTCETIFHNFMHLSSLAQIQPPQKYPSVTQSAKVIKWHRNKNIVDRSNHDKQKEPWQPWPAIRSRMQSRAMATRQRRAKQSQCKRGPGQPRATTFAHPTSGQTAPGDNIEPRWPEGGKENAPTNEATATRQK